LKNGLATIDHNRPTLILGNDLAEYLKIRRTKNKQACKPEELYCVRCRRPRSAAEGIADYSPINDKIGNLVAICPDCGTVMNRRVSIAKIMDVIGNLDVKFPEDLQHIVDRANPSVNSDLR